MTQYLLSVHMVEGSPQRSLEEMQSAYERVDRFNAELQDSGAWVFAGGLTPPELASVVRAKGGKVLRTDGPFVEGKEHIGGVWVIEADGLASALDWAGKATEACGEPVEVRSFQELPGD
ncbi:MAG TPA: YciI family protein [Acidimicrobiales bacterium]|nr:YciI family protein [Acidimicrobiales bacterium]